MSRSATQIMTFAVIDNAICIVQPGQRPVRLQPRSVEELLTVFTREGAAELQQALLRACDELRREYA